MKNTLENKSRFVALYYGQNVFKYKGKYSTDEIFPLTLAGKFGALHNGYLELTSLKDITNEDPLQDMVDMLDGYTAPERPIDEQRLGERPSEDQISDIEASVDLANKMQSSGDNTPVDDLEVLLQKINSLNTSKEDKDELEEDAMNMTGYSQGLALKEKLRGLMS